MVLALPGGPFCRLGWGNDDRCRRQIHRHGASGGRFRCEGLPTWYYTYRVQADVTDGAGETQQANLSLPLGKTSVVLAIEGLSAQMVKEKARELTFSVTNLSGEPVDTEVIYQVFKPNKSNHEPGEKVLQATVASNKKFVPEALYRLPSGSYILKISAKDAQQGMHGISRLPVVLAE